MALGGANITWDESVPSASSNIGLGEQDIRSIKTSVRNALDSEHHYSSTGGAGTGAHRKGSAVVFYGAASAVSSSDTEGRLMLTSDTSVLYAVNSATTYPIGGRYAAYGAATFIDSTATRASAISQVWAVESGWSRVASGNTWQIIDLSNTYVYGTVVACVQAGTGGSKYAVTVTDPSGVGGSNITNQFYAYLVDTTTGSQTSAPGSGVAFSYIACGFKAA